MHFGIRWAVLAAIALSACGENTPEEKEEQQVSEVKEYVSKTPGAKIYMQPAKDPKIKWIGIDNKIALIDEVTGDTILSQMVDRERRLMYLAYTTKDRESVRIFMTQWGGGRDVQWKTFPIRVWNVKEFEHSSSSTIAAAERATIARLAQFMSSWPDWADRENAFMIIDAPISEEDPL